MAKKYQSTVFRGKGVRLVFKPKAVREILTSPEVTADLAARGERVAAAADAASGGTHVLRVNGRGSKARRGNVRRARVAVITGDVEAILGEYNSRTLTRAIDAGRG
jgi:hypothetical protein